MQWPYNWACDNCLYDTSISPLSTYYEIKDSIKIIVCFASFSGKFGYYEAHSPSWIYIAFINSVRICSRRGRGGRHGGSFRRGLYSGEEGPIIRTYTYVLKGQSCTDTAFKSSISSSQPPLPEWKPPQKRTRPQPPRPRSFTCRGHRTLKNYLPVCMWVAIFFMQKDCC